MDRVSIILRHSTPTMVDFAYQQTINTLVLRKPIPITFHSVVLFNRETSLSSLSEPTAHRSMQEQLLRNFSETFS